MKSYLIPITLTLFTLFGLPLWRLWLINSANFSESDADFITILMISIASGGTVLSTLKAIYDQF